MNKNEEVDTIVSAFLTYLSNNHKETLLPEIVGRLKKFAEGEVYKGEVVSAVVLDKNQVEKLEGILSGKFKTTIELINRVDPSIIGGIVIMFGDVVIDESIRSKLTSLQQELYGS
jgi:F-type H+-transporting ATPase subunit delta